MRGVTSRGPVRRVRQALAVSAVAGALSACTASLNIAPAHLMPLPKETVALLDKKRMDPKAPIFIRLYKEESELEVWKMRDDGRFYLLKTYPICNWSGKLGPKLREGDRQSPEGFYAVAKHQMNPRSHYHLAFNLGYPNRYDSAKGRTGANLMVHGGCGSSGCYAMTDALMEEVYALMREAFEGGQKVVHVHAFPFRMTTANMKRHARSKWRHFWRSLKQGYDYFELTRQVPTIAVCNRRYLVNVKLRRGDPARLNPSAACPRFVHPKPSPFTPKPGGQFAERRAGASAIEQRPVADAGWDRPMMGLTGTPRPQPISNWWQGLMSSLGLGDKTDR